MVAVREGSDTYAHCGSAHRRSRQQNHALGDWSLWWPQRLYRKDEREWRHGGPPRDELLKEPKAAKEDSGEQRAGENHHTRRTQNR